MAIGAFLLLWGSPRSVTILLDGTPIRVRTRSRGAAEILRAGGVSIQPGDRVIPALDRSLPKGFVLRVDRLAQAGVTRLPQGDLYTYPTRQTIAGNILLDAGIRLYPGDRLYWKDTPIQGDFSLAKLTERELTVQSAVPFILREERGTRVVYGSGDTVRDALSAAGVKVSSDLLVLPNPDSPFVEGMTVEAVPLRDLLIASNGRVSAVRSGGATVGEALARAGFPLMGADVSIPAAGEPLPEDGRILIVPVRVDPRLTAEGQVTPIRYENGAAVFNEE